MLHARVHPEQKRQIKQAIIKFPLICKKQLSFSSHLLPFLHRPLLLALNTLDGFMRMKKEN
jgi:hypothetical protein